MKSINYHPVADVPIYNIYKLFPNMNLFSGNERLNILNSHLQLSHSIILRLIANFLSFHVYIDYYIYTYVPYLHYRQITICENVHKISNCFLIYRL